ncbi:GspH/FimT family pseudopilin [Oceanisphaera psychrotolerans]|uniref:Type II secretion system protein H n=1 Tax=Oceanisphaera psychrotolerans TaxID=1414654 RepID=A0A1J4QDP4_9GAMM|nr:GspH/FimT family pseudopilin [Oceanisphaera psychrotolerans]OIN10369.1 type IV pilin [Oceanisphaera psychrotolerans]
MKKRQAGLTLIELLIGLVVMAVLLSIAVPSFQILRQQYTVRSAGMAIYADLQLARSEAIKRNKDITVCFSGSGTASWKYQINDLVDPANCAGTVTQVIEELDSQNYPAVTLTASYGSLTFRPRRGTLASGNVTLSNGSQEMKIITWNNSIIRTCSDDQLIGVPAC